MPPLHALRSHAARNAHRNEIELIRALGLDIRRAREDVGVSQRRLASSAGISQSLLCMVEAGEVPPSLEALSRIAGALGSRLRVSIQPGTGPMIRDHIQAAMLQGLLKVLHPRWRRFVDVPVYRPVRGGIDLVLDDPEAGVVVATEAHSQLRRIEQQVRWANTKTEALRSGGNHELAAVMQVRESVSRLLLLRVTHTAIELTATYSDLLAAVYPARHADAVASLIGAAPWPGPALVWMDVASDMGQLREAPPRGVGLGR